MNKANIEKLIEAAKSTAKKNFCCKYSNFTVGAALVTSTGKVYTGFNIENNGIQSICAERVAFTKALSEGNKEFKCIAIVGKHMKDKKFMKTLPCGYCRQFMSEYTNKDFIIYTIDDKTGEIFKYTMEELLPENFSL